ncbi:8-oxo-dGTP diphosphatase MutT [Desulfoscipio gibsoniae]|uniref:8-oxo-dGTP diphosphatase n=1 Tax=Desulfoscipio gibsoniae DSM 7213 TaxID=767817 RepID=R4KQ16_9FIRM|nr:8-oxo-dGTP diphosphatase MutT [Desulfoscipio gibsoniae]AGL01741.1 mutator mutT protein [Desulfoscipio gibsoniae DSM 7213]
MQTIVVTAAIIKHRDRVLIAQRKENVHQALKWEFPGGKLEAGESPEQCLVREIREELGLTINVQKIFEVVSHIYGERHIILLCYLCRLIGGSAQTRDCHDFRWVEINELYFYDFAEADLPVVSNLQKRK